MLKLKKQLGDCPMHVLKGIGHTAVLENYEGLTRMILERISL